MKTQITSIERPKNMGFSLEQCNNYYVTKFFTSGLANYDKARKKGFGIEQIKLLNV